MKALSVVLVILVFCSSAYPQSKSKDDLWVPIETIISSYSERTNTKFALDPRVSAKVKLIGIDIDRIDRPTLTKILLLHSFAVIESGDVTYVLPLQVAEGFAEELAKLEAPD